MKIEDNAEHYKRCSGCKAVVYCTEACQNTHWNEHKTICKAIRYLETKTQEEEKGNVETLFTSHLNPKQQFGIAKLVGRKCEILCALNGKEARVLWDTGAQVSLVSKTWLNSNLPGIQLQNIASLLDHGDRLDLTAANGGKIQYEGYVEVGFSLKGRSEPQLTVPMLVTPGDLEQPIIGYNVIEELVKAGQGGETKHTGDGLLESLMMSFQKQNPDKIKRLVEFIEAVPTTGTSTVKTKKRESLIPRGQSAVISCRASIGPVQVDTPALFEPLEEVSWPTGLEIREKLVTLRKGPSSNIPITVKNNTTRDIILKGRTILGQIQLVRSVTPVEVTRKEPPPVRTKQEEDKTNQEGDVAREEGTDTNLVIPAVHLGKELTTEQRRQAEELLRTEHLSFAKDDMDNGQIEDLTLNIQLADHTPVQKSYTAIPAPLYPEVKAYIEDLLNRGWIERSRSSYSSPVVCVRKKDGTFTYASASTIANSIRKQFLTATQFHACRKC